MFTYFSIRLTVVAVIAALDVPAASIPRPRGKGNGISIPLMKPSLSLISNTVGTTHPSALKRSGSAALDLTTAIPDYDVWYGTISIGTPPQLFTVQVDTGSSDLFIPASTGDENCKSHDNLWDPALSITAKNLDEPFEIEFGDGATVTGQIYTDNVTIAGFNADKQSIGVATTYSANMKKSHFPADGMLGLAFQSISAYPATSLLETLISEGKLPNAVFSLKLTPYGGELYIGGVNKELYTGDITFVDVETVQGYWEVIVDDIRVNGKSILRNVVSIIDTGANFIYGDPDRVLTLHKARGGKAFKNGWYTFPCDDFPDVTLTIGGKPFTIPADHLNHGPVVAGSPNCFTGIVARVETDDSEESFEPWSIGSNFLELFYTVFQMDTIPPQVGFAHLQEISSGSSEAA